MRVLVTGGAGYIGGVTVERLLERGEDVVVLDNLWRGHAAAVPDGVSLLRCDLRDETATRQAVRAARPDAVLHFAAATLVPESVEQPAKYFAANVVGSHNLLVAMREAAVDRIVFSSTAAVYGMPRALPIGEEHPTAPINPYGRSKLMVEQMLEWYAAAYGFRFAALRYFNVAGATIAHGEEHDPETHVIPVALQVLQGKRARFSIFGSDYLTPDGTAIRDYVHVVDLADAHLLALDRLDQNLGAINLGTRDGFSVREIVSAVERVTRRELPVAFEPRRAGDPPALVADSGKATRLLGWHPQHSTLDQMVASAWAWSNAHPNGYPPPDRHPNPRAER